MKKTVLLLTLLIAFSGISQVFSPVSNDSTFYGEASQSDFDGKVPIVNDNETSTQMYWELDSVNLPSDWEFSICDQNICYPTGTQNVEWSLPADGGYINIHFYPNGQEGEGLVILKVNNLPGENQTEYMTLRGSALSNGTAENLLEKVVLYPNPASDVINIKGGSANASFEMLDILGKQIKTGKLDTNGNFKINTSSVLNGVYFISFTENGQKVTRKVVVR